MVTVMILSLPVGSVLTVGLRIRLICSQPVGLMMAKISSNWLYSISKICCLSKECHGGLELELDPKMHTSASVTNPLTYRGVKFRC